MPKIENVRLWTSIFRYAKLKIVPLIASELLKRNLSIVYPTPFFKFRNSSSNVKIFTDDTSLFAIVKDKNESANTLNNDLMLISKWAYNWKMLFTPDPSKPVQEVLL